MRAGPAFVFSCAVSCAPQPGEAPGVAPIRQAPAPNTTAAEPESRCAAAAVRDAQDGCNTCSCSADGHWICGDLPCPGCRDPYTGTDATIAPAGRSCNDGELWVRHPEARLCCRYSGPCTAPVSWRSFSSEAACKSELGAVCTPGERKSQPRVRCDEVCSRFGIWAPIDCRPERFWASIEFDQKSSTPIGSAQRELDNLAGRLIAYRITRLVLEPHAVPTEAGTEAFAKALALKRARVVRDALIRAGVSAGVFELSKPSLCNGSPTCTSVRATTENLTLEQLEAGHAYVPRWKTCEQDVAIHTELTVVGDEDTITFEFCRNDQCSRHMDAARPMAEWPGARAAMLQGAVNASLLMVPTFEQVENNLKYPAPWRGRAEYRLELHDHTPAAQLAQGDRYRFALYKSNRADPYLSLEWTAGYSENFPNGPEHDPVPCRQASVSAALRVKK